MYVKSIFTVLAAVIAYLEASTIPKTLTVDVNEDAPVPDSTHVRILGGKPARSAQLPYQVGLFLHPEPKSKSGFWCGGTLISEQYVLTAAHCVALDDEGTILGDSMDVYLGKTNRKKSEVGQITFVVPEENFIIHPGYNKTLNDIALIKLPKPATLSRYIQTAKLPNRAQAKEDLVGKSIISSGWGIINKKNETANVLQYIITSIIPGSKCIKTFTRRYFREDRQICINVSGRSTCQGDSGGPHILQEHGVNTVVGVTSFGAQLCTKGYPQVLTRVAHYLDWISDVTGIPV